MSRSANGFTSSRSVLRVQIVSLSTSTTTSPRVTFTPTRTALRLPATGVHFHRTLEPNSSHTRSRSGFRGPLMTTTISVGACWTMRRSTSRKRGSGSSTTGITTLVVVRKSDRQGRYLWDR